jgi:hypothetical protein
MDLEPPVQGQGVVSVRRHREQEEGTSPLGTQEGRKVSSELLLPAALEAAERDEPPLQEERLGEAVHKRQGGRSPRAVPVEKRPARGDPRIQKGPFSTQVSGRELGHRGAQAARIPPVGVQENESAEDQDHQAPEPPAPEGARLQHHDQAADHGEKGAGQDQGSPDPEETDQAGHHGAADGGGDGQQRQGAGTGAGHQGRPESRARPRWLPTPPLD